jgi:hypothetical protein
MLRLPLEGPRITRQLPHHAETLDRLAVSNVPPMPVISLSEDAYAHMFPIHHALLQVGSSCSNPDDARHRHLAGIVGIDGDHLTI